MTVWKIGGRLQGSSAVVFLLAPPPSFKCRGQWQFFRYKSRFQTDFFPYNVLCPQAFDARNSQASMSHEHSALFRVYQIVLIPSQIQPISAVHAPKYHASPTFLFSSISSFPHHTSAERPHNHHSSRVPYLYPVQNVDKHQDNNSHSANTLFSHVPSF